MGDAVVERSDQIAVVGMAGRFPGADDPEKLWHNLRDGRESVTFFSPAELSAAGVDPALPADPGYVPARGVLSEITAWDAAFFGFSPRDAELLDPQQRLFLECAWEALEEAGYAPRRFAGRIGVYAGASASTYWSHNLRAVDGRSPAAAFQVLISNDKDYLPTRVSFLLDLRGPSVGVQTACSSSLVAVHQACQSLLNLECDMALAGGVSISVPDRIGYLYQPDGIMSDDGHNRSFDARGKGSVFGDGVGVVLLKRLEEALEDGDHIHAVILGSAVNNDGSLKVGYTAPSMDAQAEVIAEALAVARVDPATISYVEAHGSATPLGDPIEVAALTRAFRARTDRKGFCALGSVKSNVGHLYTASGITSLIKTVQALRHRQIPPSLNFERPNPAIDFAASPFFVVTELRDWPSPGEAPRRAGVNSLGIGGTNVHVILEEAPPPEPSGPSRPWQLLSVTAKTASALEAATANLAAFLRREPAVDLADVAYTLQVGRYAFPCRRVVLCRSAVEAVDRIETLDPASVFTQVGQPGARPVVFLLGGVGDQYVEMGLGLYQSEPGFRRAVDRCAELLAPRLGLDLREALYPRGTRAPGPSDSPVAEGTDLRSLLRRAPGDPLAERLHRTAVAQPLLFTIEYALASLWMEWGVRPQAMIGHSLGEYVAACLAGVLSLEDALVLVAERARRIEELPGGAMLTVPLPEEEVTRLLGSDLSLAAVHGPASCVVSGPAEVIGELERRLAGRGIPTSRPRTAHAFHSRALATVAPSLTELARSMPRQAPQIPYVSNLTGTWITAEQATDPGYWARHMVQTVRFAAGLHELLGDPARILLEIGPGQTLGSFVRQHPDCGPDRVVLGSLRHASHREADLPFLLRSLGRLWLAGAEVDWIGFHAHERRHRVSLSTYPFERQRFWLEPDAPARSTSPRPLAPGRRPAADWLYRPAWRRMALSVRGGETGAGKAGRWLLFADALGLATELASRLEGAGGEVIAVTPGERFLVTGPGSFTVRPGSSQDLSWLLAELRRTGRLPDRIVHLWCLTRPDDRPVVARLEEGRELGFYTLLALVQALAERAPVPPVRVTVVGNGLNAVAAGDRLDPEKAPLLGLCRVVPQELPGMACRVVDVALPAGERRDLLDDLVAELASSAREPVIALRGRQRWVQSFEPVAPGEELGQQTRLRQGGVYLITGGLGHVGRILADFLTRELEARLILVGRSMRSTEAAGRQVVVETADVGDPEAMRRVVDRCVDRFGALHGVIHAAGRVGPESFIPLQRLSRADCEAHFRAKVEGTVALSAALGDRDLDFCLLFSSISTALGGVLFGAYAAANSFLDVFAESLAARGRPWLAVDWDGWGSPEGRRASSGIGAAVAAYEMTPKEATQAFAQTLTAPAAGRLVVSTGDLQERLKLWQDAGPPPEPEEAGRRQETARAASYHRPNLQVAYVPAGNELERKISAVWQRALGLEQVGVNDNFFDLGGNSLVGIQVLGELRASLGMQLPNVALFEAPTVGALARLVRQQTGGADRSSGHGRELRESGAGPVLENRETEIAIVGMAGRFPGADSVEELWQNICAGIESVSFFSDEELLRSGIEAAELRQPFYVKARPILRDPDLFDARFFGYNPREAALMDPQIRVFLECCWHALEHAGLDPQQYPGTVGLFAGASLSTYMLGLFSDPEIAPTLDPFQILVGNEKDSLPTIASYKMGLTGPSLAVQSHCSTSLVAVHLACLSLAAGECSAALAGGISIRLPQRVGYVYQEGGQESVDGHTRPFDRRATGTVFGDGAGVVVLKRLSVALAEGDTIHAVIKGSMINNDGALKAGYTAPSVEGQAAAVQMALARAGVDPRTIRYLEAHGSATPLGDPIEVAALTRAFRRWTEEPGFCALGSVKSNVGHLDRASGVTGLIKAALAVREAVLPPTLFFEEPNPELDLPRSPFWIPQRLASWPAEDGPRRAAVNALGMGGTNAHVILEQAPERQPSTEPARPWKLILLSAKTESALDASSTRLLRFLRAHPEVHLADAASTLAVGRRALEHRRVVVCQEIDDLVTSLESCSPRRVFTFHQRLTDRRVGFLFPGVGDHYPGMALGLYRREPVFRRHFDVCAEILRLHLGLDLRELLYAGDAGGDAEQAAPDLRRMLGPRTASELDRTVYAQPAVVAVEYSLARLWMEWGVRPDSLLGYSVGEYVAACLADIFSLEDALRLVAERARLIEELPPGGMLAVSLSPEAASRRLNGHLALAAVNGPHLCVLSGPLDALSAFEQRLESEEVTCRRLSTTHAFHSPLMESVADPLRRVLATIRLSPPSIPIVSNVTGTWMAAGEATDPERWVRHLLGTVRFADGVGELLAEPERVLLEVGPGQGLTSLVKQHDRCTIERGQLVLASMRAAYEQHPDQLFLVSSLGRLWTAGVRIDWPRFFAGEGRRRIPLPDYPFERQRYLLEARWRQSGPARAPELGKTAKEPDLASWFYVPVWKQTAAAEPGGSGDWLLFLDQDGIGAAVAEALERQGRRVSRVVAGADRDFARLDGSTFLLDPLRRDHYDALFRSLRDDHGLPRRLVHFWAADPLPADDGLRSALERGFHSLLLLAQALGEQEDSSFRLVVVSTGVYAVAGDEELSVEKSTVLGPCRVIPQESPSLSCRLVDLPVAAAGPRRQVPIEQIVREVTSETSDPVVALRGERRWIQAFDRVRLEGSGRVSPLRDRGVYLITGGLGGIGLGLARRLAETCHARLVLIGRSALPPRSDWDRWLREQPEEDGTVRRIRQLLQIEDLGGEVLVLKADVADRQQMREAVACAIERFGELHGILHAAGVPGAGIIQLKTPDMAERVLAPKVMGTLALEAALDSRKLDFWVLFSSVTALTGGGPGQVDYCAANAFLDAFAQSRSTPERPVVAIDWSEWQWDAWQEGLLAFDPEIREFFRENRRRLGITFEEGFEALSRVLSRDLRQVIVSTQSLTALLDLATRLSSPDFLAQLLGGSTRGAVHPRPLLGNAYRAPHGNTEETLAAIWCEVLGLETVGAQDNFLELGGHSLLATQLFSRIRKAFLIDLPLRVVFEAPTISELALRIEEARQETHRQSEAPPILPVARGGEIPLSFSQQRHWFLQHLESDAPIFNELGVVELRGELDVAAFVQSVGDLVRRHEVLRTTFPATADGQPVQVIAETSCVHVPVIDLGGLREKSAQTQLRQLLQAEVHHSFDLARGPLLRCSLFRTGRDRHVAAVNMHHIVTDGVSIAIFKSELAEIYTARVQGRPPALPELAIQYADFAAWQRSWLQGEVLERHLLYWKRQLAGATPIVDLPTDRPRPRVPDFRAGRQPVFVPPQLTNLLRHLSREAGATLFTTLAASFLALLHSDSGQDDITLGAPVANRERPEIADLLGCFINALPLRVDMSGDPRFRELLARAKETVLGALSHQDLPFEKLVEELNPERSRSHWPLFQIVFNFQNAWLDTPLLPGIGVELIHLESMAKYDLTLYLREESDAMSGSLAYQTALFEPATIERLVGRLVRLLAQVVANPDVRLSQLDLLSEAERKQRAMERTERDESNLKKLVATRRKVVKLSPSQVIETGYLSEEQKLPLVITPTAPDVDLVSWAETHRDLIEAEVLKHGGILFRGFPVPTAEVFEQFSRVVAPELINYVEGSSPRVMVTDRVYTSTEYPPEYFVSMHNELSYAHRWPSKLLFFCLVEPRDGGATPIADSRRVLAELPQSLREKFTEKGVMYVRKLRRGKGAGLSWQTVFETDDTSVIESYCREGDIEFRWEADGSLRTRQIRPAVIRHPRTGELLWFNQADQFHPSNLGAEIASSLLAVTSEEDLPINAYFGDGSPLDPAELDEVRAAFRRSMVVFPWQQGDVLLLDNMLAAHGRMPFSGPRRVVVTMGSPVSLSEITCPKSATELMESL
jgi:acyl transferase domain-containing protein/alpha-ketoglutarate-dependent taurine dioxygenase/acyl carrier protein